MDRDLISHGWLAWDDIRTRLAGASALWLEPTGYRYEPLPDSQPPTTRIHAWAGQRCWRLIPDRGRTLLTELALTGEQQARTCEVQVTEVVAWQPEYAGPVPAGLPRLVRMEITDLTRTGIFSSISFLNLPPIGPEEFLARPRTQAASPSQAGPQLPDLTQAHLTLPEPAVH